MMQSSKIMFAFGVVVGAVTLALGFIFFRPTPQLNLSEANNPGNPAADCSTKNRAVTVRGNSLGSLVPEGSKITITENYYACHDVERDDIVEYFYAGSTDPLLKSVRGLPGDQLALKQDSRGAWNILINGSVLKNSQGQAYAIGSSGQNILALYVHDYRGVIPQGAYLIMGEEPGGSLDSTRFGLVGKADIIGKLERK